MKRLLNSHINIVILAVSSEDMESKIQHTYEIIEMIRVDKG